MSEERKRQRRRTYIVDKGLQYRLIRSVSWPMAVVLLVAIGLPLEVRLLLKGQTGPVASSTGLTYLFIATICFFVFALIVQILIAVRVSHQVAGPVYRIRQTLRSFREGDHEARAILRRNALLDGVADDVNAFLEWTSMQSAPTAETPRKPSDVPSPAAAPSSSIPA